MATLKFFAGEGFIAHLGGSGLGFYGSGFGYSVPVGSYQGTTFITNSAGTEQGPQVDNVKYHSPNSGYVGSATTPIPLTGVPNYLATLNIRFEHTSAVQVQNAIVKIYDRANINNNASGVTTYLAEIIHPSTSQDVKGSGDTVWMVNSGVAGVTNYTFSLAPSPGSGGQYAGNGSNSVVSANQHDWFIALSASPDSIGSKTNYGLFFSVEYL